MSNGSDWVDFDRIKEAASVKTVLARYGIDWLKPEQGDELRGRCPIHDGKEERSFHISVRPEKHGAFKCFSCLAHGNIIDFVAAMERCSVHDAGLRLQEWFGVIRAESGNGLRRPAVELSTGGSTKETVSDPEEVAINKPLSFQLKGIDPTHAYLANRGITEETAAHFGCGFFPGKGSMLGRVVIPVHNQSGELVAYAGRSIDGSEPKYKLPAGFHKSLEVYNLHRAVMPGLIVVEGFFDCMKVHQAGYPFVVALMGCSMSERQEELLVDRGSKGIVLMLDGDEAGRQGAATIAAKLVRRVFTRVVEIPEGRQPDQMAAEEIGALLNQ